jgi:hypothetical protein
MANTLTITSPRRFDFILGQCSTQWEIKKCVQNFGGNPWREETMTRTLCWTLSIVWGRTTGLFYRQKCSKQYPYNEIITVRSLQRIIRTDHLTGVDGRTCRCLLTSRLTIIFSQSSAELCRSHRNAWSHCFRLHFVKESIHWKTFKINIEIKIHILKKLQSVNELFRHSVSRSVA